MLTDPRWDEDWQTWSKISTEELQRIADYHWTAEHVPFEVRAGLVEAEGMAA